MMRLGAPFRQPEWSALALIESPEHVRMAHDEFARAGAQVLTTNAYAVVPFHLGEERFATEGGRLAESAASMCRSVADAHGVRVAGCVPPPLGSYRPEAVDTAEAERVLGVLVEAQASFVDLWLVETQSSVAEVEVAARMVTGSVPLWVSFTVDDIDGTRLRSGESVSEAVRAAVDLGAETVLFNCSRAEVMADAARAALEVGGVPVGVYPNLLVATDDADANVGLHDVRDVSLDEYAAWAETWVAMGVEVIGGCCGADARHIAALSARLAGG